MAENKFGKLSRLSLKTGIREGKTIVEDVAFTAPYKIMNPFPKKNGGISVMPLCASAGIMEGDRQEFDFFVAEGTELEFLSQSFDKVHRMKDGEAIRHVKANVEKNAVFYYYPQPVMLSLLLTAPWNLIWQMKAPDFFCWRSSPVEERLLLSGSCIVNLPPG